MLIARERKKSNIAEYILYMWQVEDLLRGVGLDIDLVDRYVVSRFQINEATAKELHDWYDNIVAIMKREGVVEKGHIQALKNNVDELTDLHIYLLNKAHDREYQHLVTMAAANLADFRVRSDAGEDISDVELGLNALYGQFMLRLQKREIHSQTEAAMATFSKMLGYLSAKYKQLEDEEAKR